MIAMHEEKRERTEHQSAEATVYGRVVKIGLSQTLADVGLTLGATAPSVLGISNGEIIEAQMTAVNQAMGRRLVYLQIHVPRLYAGESPSANLRELERSHDYVKMADQVQITRRWLVAEDQIEEGALGWTEKGGAGFTLPKVGNTYDFGTWTIKPILAYINVEHRQTPTTALLTATYFGYLAMGDVD